MNRFTALGHDVGKRLSEIAMKDHEKVFISEMALMLHTQLQHYSDDKSLTIATMSDLDISMLVSKCMKAFARSIEGVVTAAALSFVKNSDAVVQRDSESVPQMSRSTAIQQYATVVAEGSSIVEKYCWDALGIAEAVPQETLPVVNERRPSENMYEYIERISSSAEQTPERCSGYILEQCRGDITLVASEKHYLFVKVFHNDMIEDVDAMAIHRWKTIMASVWCTDLTDGRVPLSGARLVNQHTNLAILLVDLLIDPRTDPLLFPKNKYARKLIQVRLKAIARALFAGLVIWDYALLDEIQEMKKLSREDFCFQKTCYISICHELEHALNNLTEWSQKNDFTVKLCIMVDTAMKMIMDHIQRFENDDGNAVSTLTLKE